MSDTFDPYHKWLAIPPEERPPNHYWLLGVQIFENDLDTIENAADRQMAHVRTFASGKHGPLSQKILSELATARLCLLNAQKKTAYDAALKKNRHAQKRAAQPQPVAQPITAVMPVASQPLVKSGEEAFVFTPTQPSRSTLKRNKKVAWQHPAVIGVVVAGLLAAIGGFAVLSGPGEGPAEVATHDADNSGWPRVKNDVRVEHIEDPLQRNNPKASFPEEGSSAEQRPTAAAVPDDSTDTEDAPSKPKSNPADDDEAPISRHLIDEASPDDAEGLPPRHHEPLVNPEDRRTAVPDSAARKKAVVRIREVYGPKLDTAKTSTQKLTLAKTLLEVGKETKDDPAVRYALLEMAAVMAAKSGNFETALTAIDTMAKFYEIHVWKMKVSALTAVVGKAATGRDQKEKNRQLADAALALVGDAIESDKYAAARQLGAIAVAAAHKVPDPHFIKQVVKLNKEIDVKVRALEVAEEAFATLEKNADDPEANLTAGRFLCFVKGDWERGLPMLALGSDQQFQTLALWELRITSSTVEREKLASGWWDLAETLEGPVGDACRWRARHWYRQVVDQLTGLVRTRAKQRLEVAEFTPIPDSGYGFRNPEGRAFAVRRGGGSEQSEAAVQAALEWLANHQNSDGSWSWNHTAGDRCTGFGNPGEKKQKWVLRV